MAELATQSKQERARNKEILSLAHAKIGDNLMEIVDRLMDLAKGVLLADHWGEENERVYRVPPSLEALKYLTDRFAGKPVTRAESGQIGDTDEGIEEAVKGAIERRAARELKKLAEASHRREVMTTAAGPISAPALGPTPAQYELEKARTLLS